MLDISKKSKEILISEIEYVCGKISQSSSATESIYYFSAIHGIIHRIMNLEFSSDLVFMHFVTRNIFDTINTRAQANTQGNMFVKLDERFFNKLCELLEDLKENIKSGSELITILKKLILLAYSTTGNGYYLLEKVNFDIYDI